jgi:cleavage and polyadenylation specificity factor subunit 1
MGGRGVVDGNMIMRWMELGTRRRSDIANRLGLDAEQIREDLEMLRESLLFL